MHRKLKRIWFHKKLCSRTCLVVLVNALLFKCCLRNSTKGLLSGLLSGSKLKRLKKTENRQRKWMKQTESELQNYLISPLIFGRQHLYWPAQSPFDLLMAHGLSRSSPERLYGLNRTLLDLESETKWWARPRQRCSLLLTLHSEKSSVKTLHERPTEPCDQQC